MLDRMIDVLGGPDTSPTDGDFQTGLKLVRHLLTESEERLEAAKWRLHWYEGFLATGHYDSASTELIGLRNCVVPVAKVMLD